MFDRNLAKTKRLHYFKMSPPHKITVKHEPHLKGKGGRVAVIYSNIFKNTKK